MVDAERDCDNQVHYLELAPGTWRGRMDFEVTDWRAFLKSGVGVVYSMLVVGLFAVVTLLGRARFEAEMAGYPDRGEAGVATSEIRISKFGVPLYRVRDEYTLDPDCTHVAVQYRERFGPVPGLFVVEDEYPAEVRDGGLRTIHRKSMMGDGWVGRYEMHPDGDHLDAELVSDWGRVRETVDRVD